MEIINKYKFVLIIFLLLVLLFYWFQIRPQQLKSSCSKKAVEAAVNNLIRKDPKYKGKDLYLPTDYENYYERCLHDTGLK